MNEFNLTSPGILISSVMVGLLLGAFCIELLRRSRRLPPQLPMLVNYGLGTLLGGLWLGGCVFFLGGFGSGAPPMPAYEVCPTLELGTPSGLGIQGACFTPTGTLNIELSDNTLNDASPTPTVTEAKPSATSSPTLEIRRTATPTRPRATHTPTVTPTTTATPTATAPSLPSTFDLTLLFTNSTCGTGTPQHPFTFTINGTALTLLQLDAGITTTGTYDPGTGAFYTTAQVGPGVETYSGAISLEGNLITVAGQYSYTQEGLCQFVFDIFGQTTVP